MAKHIRNMDKLSKALQPVMLGMVDELAERVYEILNYFLQEYYNSYDPKSYQRQYDFLRSAVKVEPKIKGSKVTASVYIDTESMGSYHNATGQQVASWANQGTHGGTVTGGNTPRVWDDTISSTVSNGELLVLAAEYLKNHGIPVRH